VADGSGLTVAIVALGLAQLAVLFRAAQWTGEKNKELEGKATREDFAVFKAEVEAKAAAAAKVAIDGAVASAVGSELRKLGDDVRAIVRRDLDEIRLSQQRDHARLDARLDKIDGARESVARMTTLGERFPEFVERLGELSNDLDQLRGVTSGWANAGAKLEWRLEAVEEAYRRKFGSHPRMFALREAPDRGPPAFDPESTNPGIGQHPAVLPAPPAAPSKGRIHTGPHGLPPIRREDPDEPPRGPRR
jgi:hypothetical protein